MRVALVGPELEENLGLRYLHASLAGDGHEPAIFEFHAPEQIDEVVRRILDWDPGLVGLSMVFTGRAREYLALADALRAAGYRGHVTAGGHFAAFNARRILEAHPSVDSVIHGDGEEPLAELVSRAGDPVAVAGITHRRGDTVEPASPRLNPPDLDVLSWPTRPEAFESYLGKPIANILSSRGCFGRCAYCSISAWYGEGKGRRMRQRSMEHVAEEMASLYHERGVRIFNFHDDNFFTRRERDDIERFSTLETQLARLRVGRIALQVKARPDSVTPAVFGMLHRMGLFRVFLGVESNAEEGLATLGRGIRPDVTHRAVALLGSLDQHVTYNLLMFHPACTPETLAREIEFIRRYPDIPCNFGRVEVYEGTPLEWRLREQGKLEGDWLGYGYTIDDPAAQAAFEIYKPVFLPRNFRPEGATVQSMRLDYHLHVLGHFWPERCTRGLRRRARGLVRSLNTHNADLLERIVEATRGGLDSEGCTRIIRCLVEERRAFDRAIHRRMQAVLDEIDDRAEGVHASPVLARTAGATALVLLVSVSGCKLGQKGGGAEVSDETGPPPQTAQVEDAGDVPDASPDPVPEPSPEPEPEAPAPLDEDQIASIEQRIEDTYRKEWVKLARKNELIGEEVEVVLTLDEEGTVTGHEIANPELDEEVASTLGESIAGWTFPAVEGGGQATITLEAVEKKARRPKKPKPWHICEMMMEPIDLE